MCKAMERFLWMRFVYKVAAEENADEIFFETIPCDRFLFQKFKQFKGMVQKIYYYWTSFNKIASYVYKKVGQ